MQRAHELDAEDALVRHLLVRAAGGEELPHGLGGLELDGLGNGAGDVEDAPREAGVEDEERVLGPDGARVGLDVLHRERLEFKAHQVAVGVRRVAGHEVAHLPAIAELLRVAVSGVVEEQAVVGFASVPHDELAHGTFHLHAIRILHQRDRKAVAFQRTAYLAHVVAHPAQARPACGVVAHANHERVALLVQPNWLPGRGLDLHALDPALGRKRRQGRKQRDQQHRENQGFPHEERHSFTLRKRPPKVVPPPHVFR